MYNKINKYHGHKNDCMTGELGSEVNLCKWKQCSFVPGYQVHKIGFFMLTETDVFQLLNF